MITIDNNPYRVQKWFSGTYETEEYKHQFTISVTENENKHIPNTPPVISWPYGTPVHGGAMYDKEELVKIEGEIIESFNSVNAEI
jgi:hypothetical protein